MTIDYGTGNPDPGDGRPDIYRPRHTARNGAKPSPKVRESVATTPMPPRVSVEPDPRLATTVGPPDTPMAKSPVAVGVSLTTSIPAILAMLAYVGPASVHFDEAGLRIIAAGIIALASIGTGVVTWWVTRKHTTPVADPRDNRGVPLVPVDVATTNAGGVNLGATGRLGQPDADH